jgi:hypothetical protein
MFDKKKFIGEFIANVITEAAKNGIKYESIFG